MDFTLRLVNKVRQHTLRAFDPSVVIDNILRGSLEEVLPENAHKLCSGRLFVSVTKLRGLVPLDFSNDIISQFDTREDLIQVSIIIYIMLCNITCPPQPVVKSQCRV